MGRFPKVDQKRESHPRSEVSKEGLGELADISLKPSDELPVVCIIIAMCLCSLLPRQKQVKCKSEFVWLPSSTVAWENEQLQGAHP